MSQSPKAPSTFPLKLTEAQRKVVADIAPEFTERLKLNEKDQRTIQFSLDELKRINKLAEANKIRAKTGMKRVSLRHVADFSSKVIKLSEGIGSIPAAERRYQFKITLQRSQPPIWRRIQVKDCSLDKLHEHIQTALGWTNSHLNHFFVGEQRYGDPDLMKETFEDMGYEDSTSQKLSVFLPKSGKRFRFDYEYDFGDSWNHEIIFEGCVRAEKSVRYPLCLEGERACPPEDVGGIGGYGEFLIAIADPREERHEEFLQWIGGKFDPNAFDPQKATKRMQRGLPDWRRMASEQWL